MSDEGKQIDTSHIERRAPILPDNAIDSNNKRRINREWGLITEAVRRDFVDKAEVRNVLKQFGTTPVSEVVPHAAVDALSVVDPRVAALSERFETSRDVLSQPPVPEDLITPDISNVRHLVDPDKLQANLASLYSDPDRIQRSLAWRADAGEFTKGITHSERELVAMRYRFARDIKMLALGAEVLDQKKELVPDEQGEILLPSGIKITIDTDIKDQQRDILSPHLWERRKQLKDRVYEISVNGNTYILKEKKTKFHTDTKQHGHIDGRTSQEEFAIAQEFRDKANINEGEVHVGWEKPVGCAAFPDGFQFTIFEYDEGLMDSSEALTNMTGAIRERRERYEEEYQELVAATEKFRNHPTVQQYYEEPAKGRINAILNKLGRKQQPSGISFEDYARVKSLFLTRQAREMMVNKIYERGYQNSDVDGYSYKVHANGKVTLGIFGFDFEYYEKIDQERADDLLDRSKKWFIESESNDGIGFMMWPDGRPTTQSEQAAYFAMLDMNGFYDRGEKDKKE